MHAINGIPQRFTLDAKYIQEEGRIVLNGTQALARLLLDQHRADQRQGWSTASFVTGYRGSPLGSLDMTLERHLPLFREHQVHFMPAVNEELAATALMGSQQANMLEGARYDGVVGMWYGKGSGGRPQRRCLQARQFLWCWRARRRPRPGGG